MLLHGVAIVLCFVGLVFLSVIGEPGALRQLGFFIAGAIIAAALGLGMISLLFG